MSSDTLFDAVSQPARDVRESSILAVVNYARERDGIIPLWVGEGDLPTPKFICDAVSQSLARGETFYTWQRGIPELRQALAAYHERLYQRPFSPENYFVTGSGMIAIQYALRAVANAGDEILVPSPAWPNIFEAAKVIGVDTIDVAMTRGETRWTLDLDFLESKIGPACSAIFLNSPNNPSGWAATRDELKGVINIAKRHNLWIIADETYGRYYFGDHEGAVKCAPSFYDVQEDFERIVFVNTFSKNWSMTGWRVGWVSAPKELGQVFENLVQYSTSGTAAFMQHGAVAALNEGDEYVDQMVERASESLQIARTLLDETGRVRYATPEGAFYLFFEIDGLDASVENAIKMIDGAGVGLAPGTSFGAGGQGYFRMCFGRDPALVEEACSRLSNWLTKG